LTRNPLPKDIGPARGINLLLAACLLALAVLPAWPVAMALYHDGLFSFLDWPSLFNWFSLAAAVLGGSGLCLIFTPQRVGGDITFHQGGFTVRLRQFFRKDQDHRLDWANLATVEPFELGRQTGITIRVHDGEKLDIPTRLLNAAQAEVFNRLRASAEGSGFRLDKTGGHNLLVSERQVFTVRRAP
jgi:hypothetical protein